MLGGRARKEAREEGAKEERSEAKTLPITSTISYASTTAQKVWSRGAPPLPTTAFQQSPIVSTWREHRKDQKKDQREQRALAPCRCAVPNSSKTSTTCPRRARLCAAAGRAATFHTGQMHPAAASIDLRPCPRPRARRYGRGCVG